MANLVDKLGVGRTVYDGLTNPNEFIRSFKIQAETLEWDEAKKIVMLNLMVKGKALRVCEAVVTKNAIKNFYDALIEKCALGADAALQRFYSLKRGSDSLAAFATKLNDLLNIAIPGLTVDQKTPMLKAQICLGVPENVKAMIQFNSSMEWEALLEALEKCCPTSGQVDGAYGFAAGSRAIIKQEPTDLDINFADSAARRADSFGNRSFQSSGASRPPQGNGASRFQGKCFYCGNMGHRVSECRIKREADVVGDRFTSGRANIQYRGGANRSFDSGKEKAAGGHPLPV